MRSLLRRGLLHTGKTYSNAVPLDKYPFVFPPHTRQPPLLCLWRVHRFIYLFFYTKKKKEKEKKSEAALGCPEREACRATRSDDLAVLQTERADN